MHNSKETFWIRIKKAIKSDYLGRPLDENQGLIETISDQVLTKFVSNKNIITETPVEQETEQEILESNKKELLTQIQKAVRIELDRGKTMRITINIIVWIFTLIAGGMVGVLFQKYVEL